MKSGGGVYICHHVDTEGPLHEDIKELFNRLKNIFDIDLEPTKENLKMLQNGDIKVDDKLKKELRLVIEPHTINFHGNWNDIERMLLKIMSKDFRNQMLDSTGNGWIYNWHIMDHIGFVDNPRHRDMGYLNIFNFYENIIKTTESKKDALHWHFHPIPFYKQANIPATCYDNSMYEIHQVITRRLIEKKWFPKVNRAGFHTERVDSNFFLEQWIPFDPSNQAVETDNMPQEQRDMINHRYGDWIGAPADWSLYHPSLYDWRKKGNLNRVIARVLNMKSRHRNITAKEIEKAFEKAHNGENVYLGITNHDWRDMSVEINEFRILLKEVTKKYPNVNFKFSESTDAFRTVMGYNNKEIENSRIVFDIDIKNNVLFLKVKNGELFGPQPYLAIKTVNGDYFHDNFDFGKFKKEYFYTFDSYTLELNKISKIAVASNDKYGNCYAVYFELENGKIIKKEVGGINC